MMKSHLGTLEWAQPQYEYFRKQMYYLGIQDELTPISCIVAFQYS